MAASGISTGFSWIFLYAAYQQVGVGISSLIYYLGPILVIALSPILFGEPLTRARCAGFSAVLLGALMVEGVEVQGSADYLGLAYAAGSAVCHALMVIFNKKASRVSGLENPTLQLLISFITVAVFEFATQGPTVNLPGSDWPAMLFLGLVNTGLGCYLYFSPLTQLRAQTIVTLGYLEPLSAVVLAIVMLGEPMTALQILGAALIIGGALAAEIAPIRRTRSAG